MCSPPSPVEQDYAYYELDEAVPLLTPKLPRRQLRSLVPGHAALLRGGRRVAANTCGNTMDYEYTAFRRLQSSSPGYIKFDKVYPELYYMETCCAKCGG